MLSAASMTAIWPQVTELAQGVVSPLLRVISRCRFMLRWARLGTIRFAEILNVVRVPRERCATYMTAPVDSKENPYTDRRSGRRQRVLFSSVVIREGNCGRVLDISPKGLALQTDSELACDE